MLRKIGKSETNYVWCPEKDNIVSLNTCKKCKYFRGIKDEKVECVR